MHPPGRGAPSPTHLGRAVTRRRAPLGGTVHLFHLSHRITQATADPWVGEGRCPCTHAALLLGTPQPLGLLRPGLLSRSVVCVASFRSCPPAGLHSKPTSTGPLLPRMLTHRSPPVTGFGASGCLMGAPHGGSMLGGRQAPRGRPGVQQCPCRRPLPGLLSQHGAAWGRPGQCLPMLLSPRSSCSFLRLLQLPTPGPGAGSSAPRPRRGTENPAQVRDCGPGTRGRTGWPPRGASS